MKIGIFLTIMSLISGFVYGGELDKKKFCRTIERDGSFGQPSGPALHCVSFDNDLILDNASTFFGSPPKLNNYVLVSGKVLVVENGKLYSPYRISADLKEISNNEGAVLKLVKE